jgi:hypothetical protein
MAKINYKSLKICKVCDEQKAAACSKTNTTGLVNKKVTKGCVCLGNIGKSICGWYPMEKVV